MKKKIISVVLLLSIILIFGCGGRKKGNTITSYKMGQIAPVVSFRDVEQTKELQRILGEDIKEMIKVDIIITGYSKDGIQFTPITASTEIDPMIAEGRVRVINVPVGNNHLVTATAKFPDGSSSTIKGLCQEVFEGRISEVTVNQKTTVIANVAQKIAEISKKKLNEISWDEIKHIEANVDEMHNAGIAYADMKIDILVSYDKNKGIPGSIEIKASPTVIISGESIQLTAVVYDKNGLKIDVPVVWSIEGDFGSIDQNGLFTAEKAGNGVIKATAGSVTESYNLVILAGDIEHFWVVPNVVTMMPGESKVFTVVARDKNGNSISDNVNWSVVGDIGTIDSTGNFIAAKTGFGNIQAELKGRKAYSCISVSNIDYLSFLP